MEEQLISFETAKLAKEKGFDNHCYAFYLREFKGHFKESDGELQHCAFENENGVVANTLYLRKNSVGQPHIVVAPTQSLLQKWLREEHKFLVTAKHFKQNWFEWLIQPFEDVDGDRIWCDEISSGNSIHMNCRSYDEAFEDGLQEALKLIKS